MASIPDILFINREKGFHPEIQALISQVTAEVKTIQKAIPSLPRDFIDRSMRSIKDGAVLDNPDFTPDPSEIGGELNAKADFIGALGNLRAIFENSPELQNSQMNYQGMYYARMRKCYEQFTSVTHDKLTKDIVPDLEQLLRDIAEIARIS